MTKIGLVTITYRGGDAVSRSLDALGLAREQLDPEDELTAIVLDNASGDDTAARARRHAPWASVFELPRNVGFAAACNIGVARLADVEVIVLINPDIAVRRDFFRRVAALEWPRKLAARGPVIRDVGGQLEQSARGFPRASTALLGRTSWLARVLPGSALLRRDLCADADKGARVVDWVSGACLIVPAERMRAVGPLDEGYFMYWEDADWCRRARAKGYSVLYDPELAVIHFQGSSSRQRPTATTIAFHRSAFRYWRKHVSRSSVSTAAAAVALTARCTLRLVGIAARRAL